MSNKDSSLSKDQYNLLKAFKKQITNPHTAVKAPEPKVVEVADPVAEDMALFAKEMRGVQKLATSNTAKTRVASKKKLDTQTLAKRAAAMYLWKQMMHSCQIPLPP